jgi:transcriptional regulator with XRE-family HTH domain
MDSLGSRLRDSRNKREISREALAKQVRTSAETIRKIEEGRTKSPGVHLIFNLAKELNVTPEYLLFGDKTRQNTENPTVNQVQDAVLQVKIPDQVTFDNNIKQELEQRIYFELDIIKKRQQSQSLVGH